MLPGLSGFLPKMLHVPSGLLSGAQMEVLWEKSAWRVKKTWRRHGDAHPLHTSHLRGLTRDTTPSHPACSHECRKTQHGNAVVTMKEVMELRRRQTILSGRVIGAYFVHGEVEFELGALESLQTIKRSTSWKKALVLIAVVRRRPRGGLARKFQLFQSLTVARAWDGKKQL